jgi:hypothetical protein
MSTFEGQTSVTFEIRTFRGHRLEIEERLRVSEDNKSLLYTQTVTGPDGKVGHMTWYSRSLKEFLRPTTAKAR